MGKCPSKCGEYNYGMPGPLEGLKVLELAGIGPSPYACMLLADLGADVLRVERSQSEIDQTTHGDILTRSRHTVAINLKNVHGRDLVLELSEQADVLIEGFRPGVAERLGLGPNDLLARNPRLVYGRMTGYGQEGPLSQRAGHDINYVSISGALWSIGRQGEKPVPPLNLVGDFGGGALFLAFGVVAAVLSARQTGEGQVVDAAMVDGSASLLAMTYSFINSGVWREERGTNLLDSGAHFYEVYETKDDKFVAVGSIEPKFYAELLQGLELDGEALPDQMDREHWPAMKERFCQVFAMKTRDEWTEIFEASDACVTPVLSPSEAALHPYNTVRGVYNTEGSFQPMPAPRFSLTPGRVRELEGESVAPFNRGLIEWGVDEDRQSELNAAGALN
jgi:alpha-methylacyl-CoA racemase